MSGAQLPKGVTNYLSKLVSHLREKAVEKGGENCLLLDAGRGEVLVGWTKSAYPSVVAWSDAIAEPDTEE